MVLHGLALLPVTLLPWLGSAVGGAYALTATVGGGTFLWSIVGAIHSETQAADRRVFRVSIVYMSALFGVMLAELAAR